MSLDLSPSGLVEASKCYCFPPDIAQRVKNYLWAFISGSQLSAAELAAAASCYCYDAKTAKMVLISELCDQANAAGDTPAVECTGDALAAAAKCWCFDHATAERVKIRILAELAQLSDLTPAQLAERAACYCMDDIKVPIYLLCNPVTAPEPPPPLPPEPPAPEENQTFVVISAFDHESIVIGHYFTISAAVYGSPNVAVERALLGTLQIYEGNVAAAPAQWTSYYDNYYWTQLSPYFVDWAGAYFRFDTWSAKTIKVRFVSHTTGWPDSESATLFLDSPGTWQNNPASVQVDAVALAAFDALLASPTGGVLNQTPANYWCYSDTFFFSDTGIQCMGGLVVTFTWPGGRSVFTRHANATSPRGTYYYWAGTYIVDTVTLT